MTEKKDWKRRDLVPTERFIRRPVHPKGPTRREIANFGYRLTLAMAVLAGLATPQQAADAFLRFAGAGGAGGGGGTIPAVTISNFSGTAAPAGTPVRFGHVFADGDVPTGHFIEVTDGGGNVVPTTFARRHYSGDTHPATGKVQGYVVMDLICRTARSIAGNGSDTFTLTVMAGSWPDTLPAGKTAANIITDLTTNLPVYSCTMTALTQNGGASTGNWKVDSTTGFASGTTPASTGYYRVVAEGPTCCDFWIYEPFYQGSPATQNATERARIYMTAHLNPSTGAVEYVSGQIWEHQGLYNGQSNIQGRAQLATFLGSTVLNGFGGTSGDGRTFTFDASAINLTDGTITLPGNKFCQGQLVRFSNFTGSFTAGVTAGTDYALCPLTNGSSECIVYPGVFGPTGAGNARGAVFTPAVGGRTALTNTGTGTITVQAYSDWGAWSQNVMQPTGTWDWFNASGAVNYQLHPVQNMNYYLHSNRIGWPGFNGLANSSDNFPTLYAPGTTTGLQTSAPNGSGDNPSYGSSMSEYAGRRYQEPNDLNGYVQTHRAATLGQLAWNIWIFDPATGRIVATNGAPKGPYTGLAQNSKVDFFGPGFPTGNPLQTPIGGPGIAGVFNPQGPSHFWSNIYHAYILDGGQPLCDLCMSYGAAAMMEKQQDSGDSGTKNKVTSPGGVTYWTCIPSTEPRSDAWAIMMMAGGWFAAPTEGPEANYPEASYFNDCVTDHAGWLTYVRSAASMGSALVALGGWPFEDMGQGPPGFVVGTGSIVGNPTTVTEFMNGYCADAFTFSYMICPKLQIFAQQMGTIVNNVWDSASPNFMFAYNWLVHKHAGWWPGGSSISNANDLNAPNEIPLWWNGFNGVCFSEDGHTVYILNDPTSPQIQLQNGDQVYFWDGQDVAGGGLYSYPPPEVTAQTLYYAHGVTTFTIGQQAISTFTLSTTDPTDTPVTWSPNVMQTTLASNISSAATSIPLSRALNTPTPFFASAIFQATVSGGTTLTINGASLLGTPNIGDLPYFSGIPELSSTSTRTYLSSGSGLSWTLSQACTNGTYDVITFQPGAIALGTLTGGALTLTSVIAGNPNGVGPWIFANGLSPNTQISGGSNPNYTVSPSQTLSGTQLFIWGFQQNVNTTGSAFNVAKITTGGVSEWLSIGMMNGVATMTAQGGSQALNGGGFVNARGGYGTVAAAHNSGDPVVIYPIVNMAIVTINRSGYPLTDVWYSQPPPFSYMIVWQHAAAELARAGVITRAAFDKMNTMFGAMGLSGASFTAANSVYLSWSDPSA